MRTPRISALPLLTHRAAVAATMLLMLAGLPPAQAQSLDPAPEISVTTPEGRELVSLPPLQPVPAPVPVGASARRAATSGSSAVLKSGKVVSNPSTTSSGLTTITGSSLLTTGTGSASLNGGTLSLGTTATGITDSLWSGVSSSFTLFDWASYSGGLSMVISTPIFGGGLLSPNPIAPTDGSVFFACAPGVARPVVLTVRNTGNADLTGLGATLDGAGAGQFSVSHALSASIPPGGSATLVVTFAPMAEMRTTCRLTITSNDADEASFGITLTGDSHVRGPLLAVKEIGTGEKTSTLNSLSLITPAPAHQRVTNGRLVLTNYGATAVTDLQVDRPIIGWLPATTLPPGASMSLQVNMWAATSNLLTITGNGGTVRFALLVDPPAFTIINGNTVIYPGTIVLNPGVLTPTVTPLPVINTTGTIFIQPLQSRKVVYALHWPLGELDDNAVAGGPITMTKIKGLSGNLMGYVPVSVTGSPIYVAATESAATSKVVSTLAAHFDGASKLSSNLVFAALNNFALEAWVRPLTTTGTQAMVYQGTAGVSGFGFYQVDDTLRARFGGVGDVAQTSFTVGEWVHLALVRKAGVSTFYVNGVATGEPSTLAPIVGSSANSIGLYGSSQGGTAAGTDFFTGDVDEVRVSIIGSEFDPARHLLYGSPGTALSVSGTTTASTTVGGSTVMYLNVNNDTPAPLTGVQATIDGPDAADFQIIGNPSLSPLAYNSAPLTVRFTPTAIGTRTATLHLTSNSLPSNPTEIALTGTGEAPPEIEVEDSAGHSLTDGLDTLHFNPHVRQQTLTVRNTGEGALKRITIAAWSDNYAFQILEPSWLESLAPGASVTFTIKCSAASVSPLQARLEIGSNDLDESHFHIALAYDGEPRLRATTSLEAELQNRTDIVSFTKQNEQTVTFQNTGNGALNPVATITGDNAADFVVEMPSVTAPDNPFARITFTPGATGLRTAMLRVTTDDPTQPTFDVALVGRNDLPVLALQPVGQQPLSYGRLLAFQPTRVGDMASIMVDVTNPSTAPVTDLSVAVEGAMAGDFVASTLGTTALAPGATTSFTLTFSPSVAGVRRSTIRLHRGAVGDIAFEAAGEGVASPTLNVPTVRALLRFHESLSLQPFGVPTGTGSITNDLIGLPRSVTSYQWRKNGQPILGATADHYDLPDVAALTDAGTYSVAISNDAGSTVLDYATVAVLNPAVTGVGSTVQIGRPITLKASAAGGNLTYQWYDNGSPLTGQTGPTATTTPQGGGLHDYWCKVSVGGLERTTNTLTTTVLTAAPTLQNPGPQQSAAFEAFSLALQANLAGTTFSMTGAPAGLSINSTTGLISGVVARPGSYTLRLAVSNALGRGNTVLVPFVVSAPDPALFGTFSGLYGRDDFFGNGLGGYFVVTTTSAASYTGRIVLGARSWAIAGRFEETSSSTMISRTAAFRLPNGTNVHAEILVEAPANMSVTLRASHSGIDCGYAASGYRRLTPPSGLAGRYNAAMTTDTLQRGITTPIPEGKGFASYVLDLAGNVTISGRMADGTPFASSAGWNDGATLFYQLLYAGQGSAFGAMQICPDGSSLICQGSMDWFRRPDPKAKAYAQGWAPLQIQSTGGKYVRPAAGHRLLDLPAGSPNAHFIFEKGGLDVTAVTQDIAFSTSTYRLLPSPSTVRGFGLSLNPTTGLISGAFETQGNVVITIFPPPRPAKVSFNGLLVPTLNQAVGSFQMTTTADQPVTSGEMRLEGIGN